MERVIKFRAWDGKQMYLSSDDIRHFGSWFDAHWPGSLSEKAKVLMQFTGLIDKHGVEIYEGDIFKIICSDNEVDYQPVKFVDGQFVVGTHNLEPLNEELEYWKENISVAGNIYQHPHLLTSREV